MEIIKLERARITTQDGETINVQWFKVNGKTLGIEDPDCKQFKYHDVVDSDGWPAQMSPEQANLQLYFAGMPLRY